MTETITRNTFYPWLEFTLRCGSSHVHSETRRCLRCGAEETEEAVPRILHYGAYGVVGMETFLRYHSRCEELK